MKRIMLVLLALVFLVSASFAADIDGTWNIKYEIPNDIVETIVIFKAKGAALFVVTDEGEMEVGKIDGKSYSYTIPDFYSDHAGYRADLIVEGVLEGDTTEGSWQWDTYNGKLAGRRQK